MSPAPDAIAFPRFRMIVSNVRFGRHPALGAVGGGDMGRRRWWDYRTETGWRPVREFMDTPDEHEFAEVMTAMKRVAREGLTAARHLRGEVYDVRARGLTRNFRVLFAQEGQFSQVLLSLTAFVKKTQRTPRRDLELAEGRLADWRARSRPRRH